MQKCSEIWGASEQLQNNATMLPVEITNSCSSSQQTTETVSVERLLKNGDLLRSAIPPPSCLGLLILDTYIRFIYFN